MMRTLTGELVLPSNAPVFDAAVVLIEVREVSRQDVPSKVVAETRLTSVRLSPGGAIPFRLQVPEVSGPASLSIRAHVSLAGTGVVTNGDLLTTASHPIPLAGDLPSLRVPVQTV